MTGRQLFSNHMVRPEPAFTWLGQHSFILRLGTQVILVDPFLADLEERLVPPLFKPEDAREIVTLVCCTHDHIDHLDPEAVVGLNLATDCHFLAPRACRDRMLSLGVAQERLLLLDDQETVTFGDLRVTGIKAAHEDFELDEHGHHAFLGLILESAGVTVYHAGDTVWWEGLQARLSNWRIDLALVPINGRDGPRFRAGVLGNMTFQEAADLTAGLRPGLVVPTHYGMFDFNTEDPARFADFMEAKHESQPFMLPQLGQLTPITR